MASLETKLQSEFDKLIKDPAKARIALPRYLEVIGTQVPLHSAVHILTRDTTATLPESVYRSGIIGKIDVVFRHRSRNYVCEIKDQDPKNSSFWYATKALAYCEYYKWQTDNNDYRAAIMIPLTSLKLEHQIVAGKLDIALYVFSRGSDGVFTVKYVDDTPHWKQNLGG